MTIVKNLSMAVAGAALIASSTALSLATTQPANAAAIRTGLFNTNTLSANDDDSTGSVSLGFDANFFGRTSDSVYVNNNGNLTFNEPLSTYTPFGLTATHTEIIAPYFADVDTRGSGSGLVTYGTGSVDGHKAFGVNYPNVGYFDSHTDKLNNFQVVLIDRSDTGAGNFDIEYNYNQIQWETGDASGGRSSVGGTSAHVGYSNGSGNPGTSFELPGSGSPGSFLDSNLATGLIHHSLDSDVAGRYVFSARNGSIIAPVIQPSSSVPVPEPSSTLGTLVFGALGTGYMLKRKLKKQKSVNPHTSFV
jgi:hypothetical protein